MFANLWLSFMAGLFTPLVAVCVLPLYPGFLAYMASQISTKDSKKTIVLLGFAVAAGVISSMFVFGLIFTKLLQKSLTNAIGILSPIAFGILGLVSILLIFNVDIGRIFPHISTPKTKRPLLGSYLFGVFFGVIVLPCNPASLVLLFAISTSTLSFISNLFNFILFGIGMSLPLVLLSIISASKSTIIIGFLTKYKRIINIIAGIIMLGISLYYLIFVFHIFG